MPSVSSLAVIVVNYGSAELLQQNLAPLTASTDLITVVVDNFSTDAERTSISALATQHGWLLETPATNLGFGAGMNVGVGRAIAAGATSVLLLNPDASIDAANVETLLATVAREPLTMVAPTILRPDGSTWFAGSDLYLDDGRVRSRRRRIEGARVEAWLTGACLLLSTRLWDAVGGFSDDYFLYWEDVDLSHRVVAAGGAIAVLPDATAIHAEGGTQGTAAEASGAAKSTTYYYYNIRNRLVYAALNLSAEDARRWDRESRRVAWEILLQGGRRQFLRSLAPLGAARRGLRDGRAFLRARS